LSHDFRVQNETYRKVVRGIFQNGVDFFKNGVDFFEKVNAV